MRRAVANMIEDGVHMLKHIYIDHSYYHSVDIYMCMCVCVRVYTINIFDIDVV